MSVRGQRPRLSPKTRHSTRIKSVSPTAQRDCPDQPVQGNARIEAAMIAQTTVCSSLICLSLRSWISDDGWAALMRHSEAGRSGHGLWTEKIQARSDLQAFLDLLRGQPRHPDNFIPAGLAGSNSNGRTRHIQKFRKEFDAGGVGLAVHGRSSQRDLECVADVAGDCVLLRARMDFDREAHSGGRVSYNYHRKALPQRSRRTRRKPCEQIYPGFLCVLCDLCGYAFALSPKIAVPTRTHVDPSSIATSKSCDMPIESTSISTAGKRRDAIRSRISRSCRKKRRALSGSSEYGGMVISPRILRLPHCGAPKRIWSNSCEVGATPLFASSPPTLISIRIGSVLPAFSAAPFSFSASRTESTESTAPNNSAAFAALLLCRCPIKCHSASAKSCNDPALSANSCTRFSPNTRNPAACASRIRSTGNVLLTPISAISLGSRPARPAAEVMRSRTRATFSTMDTGMI